MSVKELIDALKDCHPENTVVLHIDDEGAYLKEVWENTAEGLAHIGGKSR